MKREKIETLSKMKPWYSTHIRIVHSHHYKYLHHFKVMITKIQKCIRIHNNAHAMHTFKVNWATREFLLRRRRRRKKCEAIFLFIFGWIYIFLQAHHIQKKHLPKIQCIANAMQQMVGPEKIFYSRYFLLFSLFNNAK